MITDARKEKTHEEIIIDDDTLCTQLESGNPFSSNQDLIFSRKEAKTSLTNDNSCALLSLDNSLDKKFSSFFQDGIERSLKRLEKSPNNLSLLNSVAQNHIKNGETDKAVKVLNKILAIDNSFFPAIANLAECKSRQGKIQEAIELYNHVGENQKFSLSVLTNKSLLYFKNGEHAKALELLEDAHKRYPQNSTVLNNMGLIYLSWGKHSIAIQFLRKATHINNEDYTIFNNLGVAFAAIKNNKRALTNFQIAHSLNPSARNVIKNLVNSYQTNRKFESLISVLDSYLLNYPEDNELRGFLIFAYFELGQYTNCLKELNRSLEYIKPDDSKRKALILSNIGLVLTVLNRFKEAKDYFLSSFHLNPNPEHDIYCNIISSFLNASNVKYMKMFIDAALMSYPDSPMLLVYLGISYCFNEQYEEAKLLYNKALQIDDKLLEAYLNLSVLECDVFENYAHSIELIQKALILYPDRQSLLNNYAYCLLMEDKPKEARRVLDKINENDNVHLNATRGLLFLKEGNLNEGRRYYNKAASFTQGNKNLYSLVNQKKHLEIASYYLNIGKKDVAIQNLKKGLKFHTIEKYYKKKIELLLYELS